MKRILLLVSLLPVLASAKDASQPCFTGICSHTFEPTASAMGGTIILSGSTSAISDITPAAGWEVLNCSSSTSAQTIRLVCTGDEVSCNHLLDNGAENTIVRLPSNCGKGPFAVVEKVAVSVDQSLPPGVSAQPLKRAGLPVQDVTIHSNFSNVTSSPHGSVTFNIVGTSLPGFLQNVPITTKFDTEAIISAFKNATDPFGGSQEDTIPTITSSATKNIVSEEFSCDSFDANILAMLQYELEHQMSLIIIASGTFSPAAVTDFMIIDSASMSLNLALTAQTNIFGSAMFSGVAEMFTIPPFFVEQIIEIQSTFTIDIAATFNLDTPSSLQFSYPVGLQSGLLIYPPSAGTSTGTITKGPANATLITPPNQNANTVYDVSLTPSLNMVVDVFDVATANIALSFPSFLSTELQFNETGSPDEFDGCFRLGSQFFADGSSDSTLGGALIAEGVGLLAGVFRPIVGCFDGSTIFPIIPESKKVYQGERCDQRFP